jgi:hypothetical protein
MMALPLSKEALIRSFDKFRMNDKPLIHFVLSLSDHERNQLVQRPLTPITISALINAYRI